MLAIGLHPHLISVPHRIHELERMLDLLTASPDAGFFTGSQLADWYAAAVRVIVEGFFEPLVEELADKGLQEVVRGKVADKLAAAREDIETYATSR